LLIVIGKRNLLLIRSFGFWFNTKRFAFKIFYSKAFNRYSAKTKKLLHAVAAKQTYIGFDYC